MVTDDLANIEGSIARQREFDRIQGHMNPVWYEFPRDFDVIARFIQGETRLKFRAIRALFRHFTRREIFMLSHLVSSSSHQDWRVLVRPRKPSETPDGGRRIRERAREDRSNQLGLRIYSLMKAGSSKQKAMDAARKELGINLSDQAVEKDLGAFRARAVKRGFVDPYVAVTAWAFGFPPSEPELTVADIVKKGRPRKR